MADDGYETFILRLPEGDVSLRVPAELSPEGWSALRSELAGRFGGSAPPAAVSPVVKGGGVWWWIVDRAPGHWLPDSWRGAAKRWHRRRFLRRLPRRSVGAEIGVLAGDFSQEILAVVNPTRLYLVDPWASGQVGDGSWTYRADQARLRARVYGRFGADPRVVIHPVTSEEAAGAIADRSLDWVYIDGLHTYDGVSIDLETYRRKVKPGGILCGDDYTRRDPDGDDPVRRAVSDFLSRHPEVRWAGSWRSQWLCRVVS